MIDPIGPSLLFSGPQPPPRRHQAPPRAPASSSPVPAANRFYGAALIPGRQRTSPRSTTFSPSVSDENHIRHFHIFVRNTEISLKFFSESAISLQRTLCPKTSDPSF